MLSSGSPSADLVGPMIETAGASADQVRRQRRDLLELQNHVTWDYDSGWVGDSNAWSGIRTYPHNLALTEPPSTLELWFSPDQLVWYPVGLSGMATNETVPATAAEYRNPGMVRVSANSVEVGIYSTIPFWSSFSGATWLNYDGGYMRVRIKR